MQSMFVGPYSLISVRTGDSVCLCSYRLRYARHYPLPDHCGRSTAADAVVFALRERRCARSLAKDHQGLDQFGATQIRNAPGEAGQCVLFCLPILCLD